MKKFESLIFVFLAGVIALPLGFVLFDWFEDKCSKESYANIEEQAGLINPPEGELFKDWLESEMEELLMLSNLSEKDLREKNFSKPRPADPSKLKEFLLKRSSKARKLRWCELPRYLRKDDVILKLGRFRDTNISPENLNCYASIIFIPVIVHLGNASLLNNYFVLKSTCKEDLKIIKEYRRIFEGFDMLNRDDEAWFDFWENSLEEMLREF